SLFVSFLASISASANVVVTCSSGNTLFRAEGALPFTAVPVDPQLTVTAGAATLASATVTLNADAAGLLGFTNDLATMGNIAATYNGVTGVLTMVSPGATATLAQWQSALRAVTYNRTVTVAGNITEAISFVANDGAQNSATAQKQLFLANGPTFVNALETWGICENASATSIDGLLVTQDYINGSTVNYSVVTGPHHGSVAFSGTSVAVAGYITFTPSPITYTPVAGYVGADTIVFSVTDGIGSSQMTVLMTMATAPPQPGAIVGQDMDTVGPGPVTYSIDGPIDSNAVYNWTYSGSNTYIGGSFFAGTGNPVGITFSPYPAATSGVLSVTASNGCGTSAATTKTITVQPLQFITFDSLQSTSYLGPDVYPNGSATSELPVRFTVADSNVAILSTDWTGRLTIHPVNAGQTTVTCYQDGGRGLQPATPVTRVFVVNKADQYIDFELPVSFILGVNVTPTLNGTVSSGLPLQYSSNNTRVATIAGDQVNWLDSGTVTISAYQPGDSNYNPAGPVNATISVYKQVPPVTCVYPNPSRGIFFCVPDPSFSAESYALYNSAGQCRIAAPAVPYPSYWPLFQVIAPNAAPGTYVLKLFGKHNGKDATMTFTVMIL
ncbi:MAG TPA: Ig-like domain-containing protein, partial [Puia sp.]|nr:Ig-like domain-containing protein [Puia sp.]